MPIILDTVAVANAATGVIVLGPFAPGVIVRNLNVWLDLNQAVVAGSMTMEIALFNRQVPASAFTSEASFLTAAPVPLPILNTPTRLDLDIVLDDEKRFIGLRFVNTTGFAFNVGVNAGLNILRASRQRPGALGVTSLGGVGVSAQ